MDGGHGLEGYETALVLSGGNALGAYHLGVCERLEAEGIRPGWVVGASIGAVTAAILLGNPPETRFDQLRAFWDQAAQVGPPGQRAWPPQLRARLGNDFGLAALLGGRPGLFGPRWPGPWSLLPFMPADPALGDHRPLRQTLERLVDFDRLNGGETRLSIVAIDVESGDEVCFDTTRDRIGPEHLLASTALMPLFPPVEVGGRLLCDPGLANNLPVDRVFLEPSARPLLCIASDLYCATQPAPRTLDQAAARAQDLAMALQRRRSLAALARERELRRQIDPQLPEVLVGLVSYAAPDHERALKSVDYSRANLDDRAAQGDRDAAALIARLRLAQPAPGGMRLVTAQGTLPEPAALAG